MLVQWINAAHAANGRGAFEEAVGYCRQVLALAPQVPEAWYNLAMAYRGLGRAAEAIEALGGGVAVAQDNPEALNSLGDQLLGLGRVVEAKRCFEQAVELRPGFAYAHSNLGVALQKEKRYERAEACLRKAIALQPDLAQAHANLSGVLNARRSFEAAVDSADAALALDAGVVEAWVNRSLALYELGDYADAERSARRAIELDSLKAEAWDNLAVILWRDKRYAESERAAREAIAVDADSAESWANLGSALLGQKRYAESEACFRRCMQSGRAVFPLGGVFQSCLSVCRWDRFAADLSLLVSQIRRGNDVCGPFTVLGLTDAPDLQYRAARLFAGKHVPQKNDLGPVGSRALSEKIRIGYFSADFHNHATSYLMAGLFELHDKAAFELVGFSFGPDCDDAMRRRVSSAFDRFIDVRDRSDKEVAELARELGIDIAVDLKGYTEDGRVGIFAYRAAPVQVSYLGFPGTLGADFMDYLIADPTLIPAASRAHYSEKIVYMPHSYQVNDSRRAVAEVPVRRAAAGLPDDAFVFCCFNANYKILPETFDSWMRILTAVPEAVLWLFEGHPESAVNLRREASRRGVAGERLIFAEPLPPAEHLARVGLADLFLDTWPYNAHTTASDALWVGVPVLTWPGRAFASRVAASLLKAVGLPEMIAETQKAYETRAVELARDPARLASLREKLLAQRATAPLFDTRRFARDLESAYRTMHARSVAGLAPDHFYVGQDAG